MIYKTLHRKTNYWTVQSVGRHVFSTLIHYPDSKPGKWTWESILLHLDLVFILLLFFFFCRIFLTCCVNFNKCQSLYEIECDFSACKKHHSWQIQVEEEEESPRGAWHVFHIAYYYIRLYFTVFLLARSNTRDIPFSNILINKKQFLCNK
jgi:hypothetical protein